MVVSGKRPTRPVASNDLGISDQIWQLLTDCWSANRLNRPDVIEVRNLLHEATPAWAPLPVPGCSEDVRDDGSELDWSDADDTAKVESAQQATPNVSNLDNVFDDVSIFFQDTNISAIISRAEEPVSHITMLPAVADITNGIDASLVDHHTRTPQDTRTAAPITSLSSNSGIPPQSAPSSKEAEDGEKRIKTTVNPLIDILQDIQNALTLFSASGWCYLSASRGLAG
jgi:hypothetical protein